MYSHKQVESTTLFLFLSSPILCVFQTVSLHARLGGFLSLFPEHLEGLGRQRPYPLLTNQCFNSMRPLFWAYHLLWISCVFAAVLVIVGMGKQQEWYCYLFFLGGDTLNHLHLCNVSYFRYFLYKFSPVYFCVTRKKSISSLVTNWM